MGLGDIDWGQNRGPPQKPKRPNPQAWQAERREEVKVGRKPGQ